MNNMKKILMAILFVLAFSVNAGAQSSEEVTATVNRPVITLDETLEFKITYKNMNAGAIDVSALRQDFDILQAGSYTSVQVINNVANRQVTDSYVLKPKASGKFVIPSFVIKDNIHTLPITVEVLPSGAAVPGQAKPAQTAEAQKPPFTMTGRINNNNPFVQQEIIYTLSLIDSGGLQGSEPIFEIDNSKDWVIRSLGTPEINPLVVKGRNMREIVFKYALFPQRSGKLTIPTARFEGYVLGKPQKRIDPFKDLFGDDLEATLGFTFAEREPVLLRSKPIDIDVKPIPAANNGNWWLPASQVLLVGKWEPENPVFKVGEAVHRTVYLKANGVLDSQLPEINFGEVDGLKQYPEKPATEMSIERGSVVSIAKVSNVYIPNKSGKMSIPEVKVNWYDIRSNKLQTAVLPATDIDVLPNPAIPEEAQPAVSAPAPAAPVVQPAADAQPQNSAIPVQVKEKISSFGNAEIILLLLGAFGLGIVISYLIFRSKHQSGGKNQISDYRKYIIQKAKAKDLRGLRDAILDWCADKYGATQVTSFNDVNKLVKDKDFAAELDKLTAELYSDNSSGWDAKAFIAAFEKADKKRANKNQEKKLLPDLYK